MIMLTIADTELERIDKEKADKIVTLLGIKNVDYGDFFSGEICDFYDFYFGVLLRQEIPCAIYTDWKWHPENIFSQLHKSTLGGNFETSVVINDPKYNAFDVNYTYYGNNIDIKINFPSQLLESIEKYSFHSAEKSFVEVNFLEDGYSWLIVPNKFETERFLELTGLKQAEERSVLPLRPRYDAMHPNLALNYKQPQKMFFLPNIIYAEDDQNSYFFRYKKPGSDEVLNRVWAGRVLSGQTVKEGIATELKSELNYTGHFDYAFAGYESTVKDKEGKDVHRYRLTVLLYDNAFSDTTRSGYKIDLQKMVGFNTGLLPLYKT